MDNELEMEVRAHFNEPMLSGWEIGRCVGYAEDDSDCYIIINFPNGSRRKSVWATMVGGYTWLGSLRNEGVVYAFNGEIWNDLYRLDSSLELNGCPKVAEFEVVRRDQSHTPSS